MPPRTISKERAASIARSQHCSHCLEYSFKKLTVKAPTAALREEFGAAWIIVRVCGVCGLQEEIALDRQGDVIYQA